MSWSIESGSSHKCPNGHVYYDSDGGPCCVPCAGCDEAHFWEDMEEINGDYYCEACAEIENNKCTDCGEKPGGHRKTTLCRDCWEAGYADYKMDEAKDEKLEREARFEE